MFGLLVRYGRTIAAYRRQKAIIRELSALDDWTLKDIGISRSQIASIAIGHDPWRRDHPDTC